MNKQIIAIDESANKSAELYIIAGIIFRNDCVQEFEKEWIELRHSIKTTLLYEETSAALSEITGGVLPEIHACDMFQSDKNSVYHISKSIYRNHYIRNRAWILDALSIVKKYAQKLIYVRSIKIGNGDVEIDALINFLHEIGIADQGRDYSEFKDDLRDPHIKLFPLFMSYLDQYARSVDSPLDIYFDSSQKYDKFSLLSCYDTLKSANMLPFFDAPNPVDSQSNSFVQAADVIAYVIMNYESISLITPSTVNEANKQRVFKLWYDGYVKDIILHMPSNLKMTQSPISLILETYFYLDIVGHKDSAQRRFGEGLIDYLRRTQRDNTKGELT